MRASKVDNLDRATFRGKLPAKLGSSQSLLSEGFEKLLKEILLTLPGLASVPVPKSEGPGAPAELLGAQGIRWIDRGSSMRGQEACRQRRRTEYEGDGSQCRDIPCLHAEQQLSHQHRRTYRAHESYADPAQR